MKYIKEYSIVLVLIVIDQIIKQLIRIYEPFIDWGFVAFHYVKNTGAAFGILQNMNIPLLIVSLIVFSCLYYYQDKFTKESLMYLFLVMGGIISNSLDRIFFGHVIDFINLGWFPVFNGADSMIVIGVLGLAYYNRE